MATDKEAKIYVAANVQHLLDQAGHKVFWLMKATGEFPNRIYPVVRGDAMASAGLLSRIAEALETTADALLSKPSKKILQEFSEKQKKSA